LNGLDLAGDFHVAGFALAWLADHGLIEEGDLFTPLTPFAFVDILLYRMVTLGRDRLLATLNLVGRNEQQCVP